MSMVGYRPYVVPGQDDESIEDLARSYSMARTGSVPGPDPKVVASPTPKDDKEYVIGKIRLLAVARKGDASVASVKSLLLEYDEQKKWCLDKGDIVRLLNDADVCVKKMGFCVPQTMVAESIISMFDKNGDGCISWEEFKAGADIKETEASMAIEAKEPSADVAVTTAAAKSKYSVLLGLGLLFGVPLGIFLLANRNTPKGEGGVR